LRLHNAGRSRLAALLQISDTIAGVRDLEALLHMLAQPLKEAVDFEFVAVILHEPETDMMRLYSSRLPLMVISHRVQFQRTRRHRD